MGNVSGEIKFNWGKSPEYWRAMDEAVLKAARANLERMFMAGVLAPSSPGRRKGGKTRKPDHE